MGAAKVPSVFFGGGTPSLMPVKNFDKIINYLNRHFSIENKAEITLESNPGTIDMDKMKDFQSAGVNRLSVGVQSLDDEKLKYLGRRHSAHDAIQAIKDAQKLNLRVSGDFIYGLPGETAKTIKQICNEINKLGLQHCSLYELTIEDGTPLAKSGPIMPCNDTMAQMYTTIQETLALPRYEVSNYATDGNECRHNQNVWDGGAYIGIGKGAAGRVHIDNTWYEQRGGGVLFEQMTDTDRAVEKIITGLRTMRGVRLTDDVKNAINMDTVKSMQGLVQINNDRLCATDAGILVLDDIVVKIVR